MWVARVECRCAGEVVVVLIVVRKVPAEVQGVELSPLRPAVMLPERREDLRFGPGGCLHPRLVQRRNTFRYGLERASVFCLKLTVALIRIGSLECHSVTLLQLLLLLGWWWRAPSLVPLFEREVVPLWDKSWVRCEAHWLTLPVTHTGTACPSAEAEEVLRSCDTDSSLLASIAES